MKKIILIVSIALLQHLNISAQTYLKGDLQKDELTAEESPYIVNGELNIPEGIKVYISPGTKISLTTLW